MLADCRLPRRYTRLIVLLKVRGRRGAMATGSSRTWVYTMMMTTRLIAKTLPTHAHVCVFLRC
jgi:hypothetical protein